MIEKRDAGAALVGAVVGGLSGGAIATLLSARPAEAAPPNELLNYLIELHTTMLAQLQRLVQIGEQLIGQAPIIIQPTLTAITIEPRTIIEFIQVLAPPGKTQSQDVAIPIFCPALTTTQFAFRMPRGWYSIFRTPLVFTSDFYSPDLTMQAWLEESRIPVTFGPVPMTGPRSINLGFTIKKYGMDNEFVNNSATDALVVGEANAFWIETTYYNEFYKRLVDKIYKAAEDLIG